MKINGRKIALFLVITFGFFYFIFTLPDKAEAACAGGTADCDCNSTNGCEANINTDNNNCGACGRTCKAGDTCENGYCKSPPPPVGGLVPCGRLGDNPDTPEIDERAPCTLCTFFYMTKGVVNFTLLLVFIIAVLIFVIAGVLFLFSAEKPENIALAKSVISAAVISLVIIFSAWLLVTLFLQLIGYENVATWNQVNCELKSGWKPRVNICGDGIVQKPNDDGFNEECEAGESWIKFSARNPGATKKDWVETVYRCELSSCALKCATVVSDIGEGCYLTVTGCNKGKYVCDFASSTKKCVDVYSDPAYNYLPEKGCPEMDYCCAGRSADLSTMAISFVEIPGTALCPYTAYCTYDGAKFVCDFSGCANAVTCDELCKEQGKICIGTGLYDVTNYPCTSIVHNLGWIAACSDYDCEFSGNLIYNDCKAKFAVTGAGASCSEHYNSNCYSLGLGETVCYCK